MQSVKTTSQAKVMLFIVFNVLRMSGGVKKQGGRYFLRF